MDARFESGHGGGSFGYLSHWSSGTIRQAADVLTWLRDVIVRFVARVPARVQTKLLVAFLAIVVLLVALGAVGLGALQEANHRSDDLIRLQRKIAAYRQVQLDTQETTAQLYGVTSALQSADERSLTAVLRQLNQFGYNLERLQFVAKDEAELLGQVRQVYDRFLDVVTRVVKHVRAEQMAVAREVHLAESRPLADRLERLTNQLVNRAEAEMLAGIAASQRSYVTSQVLVIAFVLGSVALALVLGYAISWSLISPVAEIEAGLRRVAAGDLTSRVHVANRDELGALATNVNRMSAALEARTGELQESLEYQTAISELLQVISRSASDIQPVLDTMLGSASRLCDVQTGSIAIRQGDAFRSVAMLGLPDDFERSLRQRPLIEDRGSVTGRVLLDKVVCHIPDVEADSDYNFSEAARLYRSVLGVPLLKEGEPLGVIVLSRQKAIPFTERQIALIETFADQAVIAMENARLLNELTRREQELSVTFEHMGDGVVMFDADLRIASWNRNFQTLLEVPDSFLTSRPALDDYVRLLVERGELGHGNAEEEIFRYRKRAYRTWSTERTRPDGRTIEVRNNPIPGGGAVLIYADITERKKAETEIRAARDAAETALERQTATADILGVISRSPTDVQPTFEAIAVNAAALCEAEFSAVARFENGKLHLAATNNLSAEEAAAFHSLFPRVPAHNFVLGRAYLDGCAAQVDDALTDANYDHHTREVLQAKLGYRTFMAVPILRAGTPIGAVGCGRRLVKPFSAAQIQVLDTFAAQAVIAIENVRLFTELRETLEQQTASAEILRVISQSPTDVQPVLDAIAESAVRLCAGEICAVYRFDGTLQHLAAHYRVAPDVLARLRQRYPQEPDPGSVTGRAILERTIIHVSDVVDDPRFPGSQNITAGAGYRAVLAVPMMRDEQPIGVIFVVRLEATPFSDKQIELLRTFAAQAVIAIQNVRLFTELRESLERLKAAQANLIQSEKMASLGQLTAGIAHEIKNPLNFVNNFASLSSELVDELKQAVDPLLARSVDGKGAEVQETMELLDSNLAKILEHGRRADGIVKSMLAHSRGGTGDWQTSNINGLVEEALNLAYHGARAQDQNFNVTLERDFDHALRPLDVVPQDVTRVFLNVFGNGFYATRKRQRDNSEEGYQPTLRVSTRDLGDTVEVRVRDNGIGIAPELRDKLFQPFFTTKPTGEGTGLGLSISYDIVTQQHGGSIEVESEVGRFTEFTVRLPRARRVAATTGK